MPKHSSHILALARRGAEARVQELLTEMKVLTESFPHLRDAFSRDELPIKFILRKGRDKAQAAAAANEAQPRQRRTMSAAARRKISLAQKRRWAKEKESAPLKRHVTRE